MLENILWRSRQLKALFGKIARKTRQEGASKTAREFAQEIYRLPALGRSLNQQTDAFDKLHGTDTGGIIPLWKLRIESPHRDMGVRCQSSDPEPLRKAIENLPIDPSDYAFIDLGSGKGRTLLVAAEYPFRQVAGVEFSPEMHAIATANIRKCRKRFKCGDVASFHSDAATWTFPKENMVVFLYNPFDENVLRLVIDNLRKSTGSDKSIYILYFHPVASEVIENSGFIETISRSAREAVYRVSSGKNFVVLGILAIFFEGLAVEF